MLKYTRIFSYLAILVMFLLALLLMPTYGNSAMVGLEGHEKYIYPVVRITHENTGGSGTIIYSVPFSTYILTNYHVIEGAISIEDKWDTDLQKKVKTEKRAIVYVEIFQYRELSTPIGTLKIEAEIVLYDEDQDVALIKLRSEEEAKYVAKLLPKHKSYRVMDETVAVGCSLGFPPLPTIGVITRKDFQIDSLPYDMSSSQIIYGNSGGAMFLADTGELIGIPSMLAIVGWGNPITHMGLFIPINRILSWLEEEHYDFIYDSSKSEQDCLDIRVKEIEAKKNKK